MFICSKNHLSIVSNCIVIIELLWEFLILQNYCVNVNNYYKNIAGQPIVVFRTDKKTSVEPDETYLGSLLNFDELYTWVQQKCIPLVREITFENAEELTEEGLPFLILFHKPTDTESVKKYKEIIKRELESEKRKLPIIIVVPLVISESSPITIICINTLMDIRDSVCVNEGFLKVLHARTMEFFANKTYVLILSHR